MKFTLKSIKKSCKNVRNRFKAKGKIKYFCIGRNKTGTTSLKKAFEQLGFAVGDQRGAELLYLDHYFLGNFAPIIEYCLSAQVFQDMPFSAPGTFKHLDNAYPGSKFILTVRDDSEQWYRSITRFHAKKYGSNGFLPTTEQLHQANYIRKGAPYNIVRLHGTPDHDPYNKEIMIAHYEKHNRDVEKYFIGRESDLLVINIAQPNDYRKFIEFLGIESPYIEFPWENKT